MTKLVKLINHEIDDIAFSMENYITFKLGTPGKPIGIVFLDSFKFLPTSLETVIKNLKHNQFSILNENYSPNIDLEMITRKGVYILRLLFSFAKFKEK